MSKLSIIIIAAVILLVFLLLRLLFHIVFYVPDRKTDDTAFHMPKGKIYDPYIEELKTWMQNFREFPHEEFSIQSFDGLTLYGNFYEYKPDAPIELMFHGYRGTAERDLSIGIQRCFSMGRSALIVHQRASGKSQGNVISFGINEHRDCLSWVDFAISHFGKDVTLVLTGISMGASTVLMAAGKPLPSNVKYVLADCGYSSAREIIKKCIRQIHLPANVLYPFVKLSAKLYGHFDLDSDSPLESMKTAHVPVIFIHGKSDDFVPCEMSKQNYEVCTSEKELLFVDRAGHGIAYMVDKAKYVQALLDFSSKYIP